MAYVEVRIGFPQLAHSAALSQGNYIGVTLKTAQELRDLHWLVGILIGL